MKKGIWNTGRTKCNKPASGGFIMDEKVLLQFLKMPDHASVKRG
jgi:hypothetical protein